MRWIHGHELRVRREHRIVSHVWWWLLEQVSSRSGEAHEISFSSCSCCRQQPPKIFFSFSSSPPPPPPITKRKIKDHLLAFRPKTRRACLRFAAHPHSWTEGDDENLWEIIWRKKNGKTVSWRNLSNDLYWILLRHFLLRHGERAGAYFSLREWAFNRSLGLFFSSNPTPIPTRRASLRVLFLLSPERGGDLLEIFDCITFPFSDFPTDSATLDHSYAKNFNENRTDFSLIYRLELFIFPSFFFLGRRSFAQ